MGKNVISQDDEENGNMTEDSNEEPDEQFSEEFLSHPVIENDCSEQSSEEYDPEELDEEEAQGTSEESDPEEFEDDTNRSEQPVELLSEEEEVEPTEEAYEEAVFLSTDNGYEKNDDSIKEAKGEESFGFSQLPIETVSNDLDCHDKSASTDSTEKKRSLDAEDGDCHLVKKCKQDHSFGTESDLQSASVPQKSSETPNASISEPDSEQQKHSGSSGKRRRSRWESQPECDVQGDETAKRRKTRWADDDSRLKVLGPIQLPDFVTKFVEADLDPEIQELKQKLLEMNRKIQSAVVHDEKLILERQDIIARLIDKNPTFKPASDYKPQKLCKRLYIPLKEYPDYNFVGLILGPRGLTQKRMEKESGARILLRGKGSLNNKLTQKPDPYDDADMHVLIEADNQKSLDDAVGMVEKLLIPVEEGMNEHKRGQLRELAQLNNTIRDEKVCSACHEEGHRRHACPSRSSLSTGDSSCDICGGSSHSTANCPLTMSTPGSHLANQQKSFLADLAGAGGFTFSTPKISSCIPSQGNTGFGISTGTSNSLSGPCSTPTTDGRSSKEVDDTNLYVGYLPQSIEVNRLRELFAPFGKIIDSKVIKDLTTGCSKGYGFVKYENSVDAAAAVMRMNGYRIDGKSLAVRVANNGSSAVTLSSSRQSLYGGNVMFSQASPSPIPISWPGPPGSMLPDAQFSSSKKENFCLPPSSIFLGHSDSSSECHPPIPSTAFGAQFPGIPDYSRSLYSSFLTPPSSLSPQLFPTHTPISSSSISPFSWTPGYPPGSGPF